jgi:hypothetical protein
MMLKVHQEDHNTSETQSSQPIQSSKWTLLNFMTLTNYFRSRPFSQIGLVSNLPQKLVGLQTFLAKKNCISHDTHIVKKQR